MTDVIANHVESVEVEYVEDQQIQDSQEHHESHEECHNAQPDQSDEEVEKVVHEKLESAEVTTAAVTESQASESPVKVQVEVEQKEVVYNPAEVTQELHNLHNKINEILCKTFVRTSALRTSAHEVERHSVRSSVHESPVTRPSVGLYTYSPYTTSSTFYVNPFSKPVESLRRSYVPETSSTEYKPNYDKAKLDSIIDRILTTKHTLDTIKNLGSTASTYTRPYEVSFTRESHREAVLQTRVSAVPQTRVSAVAQTRASAVANQVAEEKVNTYFCGQVENDADSIIDGQFEEHVNHMEVNKQEYVNYYTGSLVDDIDEKPRTKRIGTKRQQIINSKKQAKVQNSELVKKGPYDQKNQVNTEDAKKFFAENEGQIEDFDFSKTKSAAQ